MTARGDAAGTAGAGATEDLRFAQAVDRVGAAALFVLLATVLSDPMLVNHDAAALLFASRMLLDGRLPFVGYFDLNPPLIDYVLAVPALVARAVPLPVPVVFNLMLVAAVALSWRLARRTLAGSGLVSETTASLVALAPLVVSGLARDDAWGRIDFGQREHLFFLLAVPYLVARWRRWEDRPTAPGLAVGLGLAAGLFASLKPIFLVTIAAPELLGLVRHRRPRALVAPETLAAAAVVLAYAAHFALLPAAVREAFFHRWLPLIANGYAAYDAPLREILARRGLWGALGAAALPFLLRPSEPSPAWRLARAFSVATIAAAAGFVLQHKGWSYHLLPAVGGAVVLALLMLAESTDAGRRLRVAPIVPPLSAGALSLAAGLCVLAGVLLVREGIHPRYSTAYHVAIAARSDPGDAVLFLDTDVVPQHPTLLELGRRPGSRYYGNLFTLPMLYRGARATASGFPYHEGAAMPEEERRLLNELAEDVRQFAPRIVFVPTGPAMALPPGFSILEWLNASGWTARALAAYAPLAQVGNHLMFVRRADLPAAVPAARPSSLQPAVPAAPPKS